MHNRAQLLLLGWQVDDYSIEILPTDIHAYLLGTPTTAGEYTFTVRATRRNDERFTATKEFTVVISEQRTDDPEPTPDPDPTPDPEPSPDPEPTPAPDPTPDKGGVSGSSGGGGCNSGIAILALALTALITLRKSRN